MDRHVLVCMIFAILNCIGHIQSQQPLTQNLQQASQYQNSQQQQRPQQQIAYPVYGRPMLHQTNQLVSHESSPNYNVRDQHTAEELRKILNHLESHEQVGSYFSRNKRPNPEVAAAPLESHVRKTSLYNNQEQNQEAAQCRNRIIIDPDTIIDSKASTERGAVFLGIEKIPHDSNTFSLNQIQESCIQQCCNTEGCDNSLLSLKLGTVIYLLFL
jgi:hypothetical protein